MTVQTLTHFDQSWQITVGDWLRVAAFCGAGIVIVGTIWLMWMARGRMSNSQRDRFLSLLLLSVGVFVGEVSVLGKPVSPVLFINLAGIIYGCLGTIGAVQRRRKPREDDDTLS